MKYFVYFIATLVILSGVFGEGDDHEPEDGDEVEIVPSTVDKTPALATSTSAKIEHSTTEDIHTKAVTNAEQKRNTADTPLPTDKDATSTPIPDKSSNPPEAVSTTIEVTSKSSVGKTKSNTAKEISGTPQTPTPGTLYVESTPVESTTVSAAESTSKTSKNVTFTAGIVTSTLSEVAGALDADEEAVSVTPSPTPLPPQATEKASKDSATPTPTPKATAEVTTTVTVEKITTDTPPVSSTQSPSTVTIKPGVAEGESEEENEATTTVQTPEAPVVRANEKKTQAPPGADDSLEDPDEKNEEIGKDDHNEHEHHQDDDHKGLDNSDVGEQSNIPVKAYEDDDAGNTRFFIFLIIAVAVILLIYMAYINRAKIMAIVVEGWSGRGGSSRRQSSSTSSRNGYSYQPLSTRPAGGDPARRPLAGDDDDEEDDSTAIVIATPAVSNGSGRRSPATNGDSVIVVDKQTLQAVKNYVY